MYILQSTWTHVNALKTKMYFHLRYRGNDERIANVIGDAYRSVGIEM